jgi:hypothetical protein
MKRLRARENKMRRFIKSAVSILTLTIAGGCAMESMDDMDQESQEESQYALSAFGESPTTLTLYSESKLWGDKLTVKIDPVEANETVRAITRAQLDDAGMLGRTSSVRLKCGSRAARVVLFNTKNTSTNFGAWSESGSGRPLDCEPGETVTINLHTQAPLWADNVGSVYFVSHAREAKTSYFSSVMEKVWQAELDDLGGGAEADGGPRIRLTSSTRFTLRQDLVLDDWRCGEHDANFTLKAHLYQNGRFSVSVANSYVHTGWGDSFGCREEMRQSLKKKAIEVAGKLEDGLDLLASGAGDHPRYYLVPSWSMREFELVAGGEPLEIVYGEFIPVGTATPASAPVAP